MTAPAARRPAWRDRFEAALARVFGGTPSVRSIELPLIALGISARQWLGDVARRPALPSGGDVVEELLRRREPHFVGIDQATAAGIRELVRRHLETGGTVEQIASLIRYRVGLTAGQQGAVDAFRSRLQAAPGGLSEVALQQQVADYALELRTLRARTIATTEAGGIWNGLIHALMAQLGVPAGVWWTRRDERVRASHRPLHGTCRPTGEPWITIYGNALRFPHDPDAPAEEVVNCRCVVLPRARPCRRRPLGPLASIEEQMTAARQADSGLDRGIHRTTDALQAAFWDQEQALQRALRELGW